jgi:hypothetical protein
LTTPAYSVRLGPNAVGRVDHHPQGFLRNGLSLSPYAMYVKFPWAPILWVSNTRGTGARLKALGWKSDGQSIFDSSPEMVDAEVGREGQFQKLTFA